MNYEFITIIVGFITIIFTMVNLNNQLRNEMNNKFEISEKKSEIRFEKLENKQDENFKILLTRIDAVNSRLDNLYHELFKKGAA